MNGPPLQDKTKREDKKLSETETEFILDKYLLPEHRSDPNIIRFIMAYLVCRHPKQAAQEVGIASPLTSGRNLLARPDIAETIQKLTDKALHKYGFTGDEVVERVKEIADANIFDFLTDDMQTIDDKRNVPLELQRAVKKFKITGEAMLDINGMPMYGPDGKQLFKNRVHDIELYDKIKSTELLGREKQLFKETKVTKHEVSDRMASILLAQVERAKERTAILSAPAVEVEFKEVKDDKE